MKLLRPGSSPTTDKLFFHRNRSWTRISQRLDLQIPMRTFAYLSVSNPRLGPVLRSLFADIGMGVEPTDPQLYAQLQQMLLEVCRDSCPECLDERNPFNDFGKPSRSLARAWLSLQIEQISVDSNDLAWIALSRQVLRQRGRVSIVASEQQRLALARGLLLILSEEVDIEGLLMPAAVVGIQRRGDLVRATLHIKDFVYG